MDKQLFPRALEAQNRAYAPYSMHPVGAAILTADGEYFSGANVENSVYPSSIKKAFF
jgi:cytidine deaminase